MSHNQGILEIAAKHLPLSWANLFSKSGIFLLILLLTSQIILANTPLLNRIEQASGLGWLYEWRGPITPPNDIVIVSISQDAANNLQYPSHLIRWSRTAYANLVQRLQVAGAATLVFDIAFIESRPQEDAVLAQALERHGRALLFNYMKRSQTPISGQGLLDIEQQLPPPEPLRSAAAGYASFTLSKFPAHIVSTRLWHEQSHGLSLAQPLLAMILHYHADVARFPGIIRDINGPTELQQTPEKNEIAHYIEQLHQTLLKNKHFKHQLEAALIEQTNNTTLLALYRTLSTPYPHTINFYGPPSTLNTLPIDQALLIDIEQLKNRVNNKVVYIGLAETAQTEQQDAYRTVYTQENGLDLSGVEISATVLGNLLDNNAIQPLTPFQQTLILIFACLFSTILLLILSLRWGLILLMLCTAAYFGVAIRLFSQHNLWLPLAAPLIIVFLCAALALYFKLVVQSRRQQNVQTALAKYLPSDIADTLSYNVSALESQYRLVQGVCLMTDIHGYTSVSEQLSPTELHKRLNRYYKKLIDVVNKNNGAVANIVGDSLLAVWTAEQLDNGICETALATASEIMATLQNTQDTENNFPTSIALHCGEFSLGHLGAGNHFEYSPVGDIVNTTSRIEQLNRKLGTTILCSAHFVRTRGEEGMRYQGEFVLKNKQEPLVLYAYQP